MDCTILCEDGHSLEAHNVIFAACTPFFRNIPRRNSHQHPLIYLKGTIKKEMGLVLNFMYQGEVEMPEEDLNSFLVTANQLRVKGLQQDNSGTTSSFTTERNPVPPSKCPRLAPSPQSYHQDNSDTSLASTEKQQAPRERNPLHPQPAPPPQSYHQDDDDIQEVQPNFKSRPVSAPAEVTPQQQQDLHVEYGEDLRVKGLTQDNHNSGTSSSSSTEKQHAPSSKLSRPLAPLGRDLMPSPQRLWPAPPSTELPPRQRRHPGSAAKHQVKTCFRVG